MMLYTSVSWPSSRYISSKGRRSALHRFIDTLIIGDHLTAYAVGIVMS